MKSLSISFYRHFFLVTICCFVLFVRQGRAQSGSLEIGTATRVITPDLGHWLQGAGIVKRVTKVHDNLEANGIYFSNGENHILMISCDLVGLEPDYETHLREAMGVATGISPRDVIISATHTHGGPSLIRTNYIVPLDSAYMKKLKGWLIDLAKEAVHSAQPGEIGWATGKAQIGWNRRYTWADGSHTMHGDATRPDFTGLEGPDDPQQTTLFAKAKNGKLLAIMYNNTTHPVTFYGAGVYSSDFPGYARKKLRKKFGEKLPVLFLNGAQGDIEPRDGFHPRHVTRDEQVKRLGNVIYNGVMDQYHEVTSYNDNPEIKHVYKDLKVGVRLPTPQRLAKSRNVLARIDSGAHIRGLKMEMAFGAVHLQKEFGDAPFDILPIHAIRIGGLAILTEPCELYCQFGLNIKRRSPVKTTMVVGLTDGYHGYVPTIYGLLGGGYSGKAISWTRLKPYAGYRIVETASQLLNKLWSTFKNTDEKEIATSK